MLANYLFNFYNHFLFLHLQVDKIIVENFDWCMIT